MTGRVRSLDGVRRRRRAAPTDISGQPGAAVEAAPAGGTDISGQPAPSPRTLDDVRAAYTRWLGENYDLDALTCVLAVAAAEQLDGAPPWLLIVGGPGAAKTETILPLGAAGAVSVSTINGEAGLLSGTSKKDRAKSATGGLLRQIGPRGLLVIKDVTSILSMNRDTRALVLAAMREVYDGHWTRNVGTDGGQTLRWDGRLVVIGAVTTAWDAAHQVIASMGDRFLLVRLDSTDPGGRLAAGRQAMRNVSSEDTMRRELSEAVAGLLSTVDPAAAPELTDAEIDDLLVVADLVTSARTAVERDFAGEPMFAHAPEMPTRMAKQLVQVARGAIAIGVPRDGAIRAAHRCAADSMPPLRFVIVRDVGEHPQSPTADVVRRLQIPRKTVDRALRELQLLGLLSMVEAPWGSSTRWIYSLSDAVNPATVKALNLARNVTRGDGERG